MKKIFSNVQRGFTLIELLVVIGLIAVLAAGVGVAIRDNNPSSSLRSGQGLILSALSAARGQAALSQVDAKVIVQADNAKPNFLRLIRIVISTNSPSNTTWKQVGGDILLPEGVYVVPSGSVNGLTPAGVGRRSTFFTAPGAVSGVPAADSAAWLSSAAISPLGAISSIGPAPSGGNIVVGSGKITGQNLVTLDNYDALRGLVVSRYGVSTLVNNGASFD